MPQASDDLRAKWLGGDAEAIEFLERKGWTLDRRWEWTKPWKGLKPDFLISKREWSAIRYLIEEWDFGGLAS